MALSAKQKAFINEYLIDFNATRAAERAGYKGDAVTLASVGWENLRKPQIAEAIRQRLSEKAMGPDEVLMRLGEQARVEYSEYLTVDADRNPAVDVARLIADGKAHLIKSIKHTRWGRNIEFYDGHAAKELIGKHHGLFDKRGSEEEPVHNVEWTVEQWKAEQAERQKQAAETMEMFDDE